MVEESGIEPCETALMVARWGSVSEEAVVCMRHIDGEELGNKVEEAVLRRRHGGGEELNGEVEAVTAEQQDRF
jgi:hypothetical protein